MHCRRTALFLLVAALPACGLIADIQPLTVAEHEETDAAVVDEGAIPVDADPDAPVVVCSVKTTPLRLPGATDQSGDPQTHLSWTGTDAIKFDDDAGATVGGFATYSRELLASSFGFAIPPAARILGVTVQVRITESGGTWMDYELTLEPPGDGGTAMSQAPPYNSQAYEIRTYGGPDELWGMALEPSIVNQATFGVDFQARHGNLAQTSISVDYIKMQVTYSSCE